MNLEPLEQRQLLAVDVTTYIPGGPLVLTGDIGGASNDNLVLSVDGTGIFLQHNLSAIGGTGLYASATDFDPTLATGTVAVAGLTTVTFNAFLGDDSLVLDFANGNAAVAGTTFDGGLETLHDQLTIQNGTFTTITNSFGTPAGNAFTGTVQLTAAGYTGNVQYIDLEPVLINVGSVTDLVFNLPAGDDAAALGDSGSPVDGLSRITSGNATFETTTFTNPSGSLTVNMGNSSEQMTIATLDTGFAAQVKVNAGAAGGGVFYRLALSYGATNIIPAGGIQFTGDGSNSGLTLTAGAYTATTITHNFTSNAAGNVNVDGRVLSYSAITPSVGIFDQLPATNRVFNLNAAGVTATVGDDASLADTINRITTSNVSSATTDFKSPTASLRVNATSGTNAINVNAFDSSGFNPSVQVDGGTGVDTITSARPMARRTRTRSTAMTATTASPLAASGIRSTISPGPSPSTAMGRGRPTR